MASSAFFRTCEAPSTALIYYSIPANRQIRIVRWMQHFQ